MRGIIIAILSLIVSGCTAESTSTINPQTPPPLPPPSNFEITLNGTFNLTPPMTVESGLPSCVKVTLHVAAHSDAISSSPMQSRNDGQLSLLITDGDAKRTFVDVETKVNGVSTGTPDEGLVFSVDRFIDAASLVSHASSQLDHATH